MTVAASRGRGGPTVDLDVREGSVGRRVGLVGDRPGHRDLAWLASVLWPNADVELSPARVPPGRRVAEAYAVMPSAERPALLVPFASPALVDPAMRANDGDPGSVAGRVRRSISVRAAASSAGRRRFPPFVVSYDRDPSPGELPTDALRRVLGRPDTALAISFGAPPPDEIPAVFVLSLDGEILGSAKVASTGATRALLRNDASALRRWAERPPRTFGVPRPIHHGEWFAGRDILVTAPLGAAGDRERHESDLPSADVLREIAATGGTGVMPLVDTPWWRSVLRRTAPAPPSVATVVRWMADLHGRRLVRHGSWHGDLVARNVTTIGGRLHVRGWERAADGAPLGLDAIHFHFQDAHRHPGDVARAARLADRRAKPTLRALGIPHHDDVLLSACHLAEVLLRFCDGGHRHASEGAATSRALLDELRRWVGRA